ncbi:MAG: ABC transporter ATP-binding protein [Eubacteriales bacterium]|nr:ABC transporter ATP-binding protein [Eubacteriales bacterium]
MDEMTIQISGLSKSYAGKKVIENISLSVAAGEVYGLLGANGAGKSTTVECILGTRRADEGTSRILGLDPGKDRKRLFEQVGVQFQESNYPDKIKVKELCEETACLYRKPADHRQLLKRFGLAEKKDAFVNELSGGQKQKLFIILALLSDPKVVFLDELTTGLDTKARRNVWKTLLELKEQGLTIFLTSHFMDEVEILCDRISILRDGGFVFTGTVQEAMDQSACEKFEDAYLWFTGEEAEDE